MNKGYKIIAICISFCLIYQNFLQIIPNEKIIYPLSQNPTESEIKTELYDTMDNSTQIMLYEGIPSVYYPSLNESKYYTVTTAIYGLNYYDIWQRTKNDTYRLWFLNTVDAIINFDRNETDFYNHWYINFTFLDWKQYDTDGMMQTLAMRVLYRAYLLTENSSYLSIINKSLNFFDVRLEEGGFTEKTDEGNFYLHCPSNKAFILNGHLFAILGLYEIYNYTSNINAYQLYFSGMKRIKAYINLYDNPTINWSRYNNWTPSCTDYYHLLHVTQLQQLYLISNEPIFDYYSKLFFMYYYLKYPEIFSINNIIVYNQEKNEYFLRINMNGTIGPSISLNLLNSPIKTFFPVKIEINNRVYLEKKLDVNEDYFFDFDDNFNLKISIFIFDKEIYRNYFIFGKEVSLGQQISIIVMISISLLILTVYIKYFLNKKRIRQLYLKTGSNFQSEH